ERDRRRVDKGLREQPPELGVLLDPPGSIAVAQERSQLWSAAVGAIRGPDRNELEVVVVGGVGVVLVGDPSGSDDLDRRCSSLRIPIKAKTREARAGGVRGELAGD